jgi:hypothetical protein
LGEVHVKNFLQKKWRGGGTFFLSFPPSVFFLTRVWRFSACCVCCVLRAACCVLRAVCCVLRAACCVLRAAQCQGAPKKNKIETPVYLADGH